MVEETSVCGEYCKAIRGEITRLGCLGIALQMDHRLQSAGFKENLMPADSRKALAMSASRLSGIQAVADVDCFRSQ